MSERNTVLRMCVQLVRVFSINCCLLYTELFLMSRSFGAASFCITVSGFYQKMENVISKFQSQTLFQQQSGNSQLHLTNQEKHWDRQRHWNVLMGYSTSSKLWHETEAAFQSGSKTVIGSNQESKAITCQKCKLLFYGRSRVSNLNKHVGAMHLLKRPHVCEECGKAFQYLYKLNRHKESVHLGLKPYNCPDCNKQFSDRSNMTKHVKNRSCFRAKSLLPK